MAFKLTKADRIALDRRDTEYIEGKAEDALFDENYHEAIEYYRLSAALGSEEAYLNLGYCYLYGRGASKNVSLAVAYFKLAAELNVIEALYKLGNIYGEGTDDIAPDKEVSLYYYEEAAKQVIERNDEPVEHPDLYFSYAKELMKGEDSEFDLEEAYDYLLTAHEGYAIRIEMGLNTYKEAYDEVDKALNLPCFDEIRAIYEDMAELSDEDYEDECDCGHHH